MGIGKDSKPTHNFARGMELHAKVTLLAKGCRGSLTKKIVACVWCGVVWCKGTTFCVCARVCMYVVSSG